MGQEGPGYSLAKVRVQGRRLEWGQGQGQGQVREKVWVLGPGQAKVWVLGPGQAKVSV